MKFSVMWLKEWVHPSISTTKLMYQLTISGFTIDKCSPVSNFFCGIVIGEIVECNMHPEIPNIWITKINNGQNKLLNIICNANNCRKNLKVVVANIGAILPNKCKVSPINLHNQLSEGILCSYEIFEMTDNDCAKNIIELPKDAPIGYSFYSYLHFYDKIIDINITPNRGDCLNIIGMAREIAAINHLKLKKINIHPVVPTIKEIVPVSVTDSNICPKLSTKVINNVDLSVPTPLWIKEKLRRCGICSINIIMDIANYVLLEYGIPVNIFDYEKIIGIIQIRLSKKGETLTLSNKKILKLLPNTPIIADEKNPLSIAGIITGIEYSIHSNTQNIILQSAFFKPSEIAMQSQLYNINTLSSYRYARGIDPNMIEMALEKITLLLFNTNCHGNPGPITSIIDHNTLPKPNVIILHYNKLYKILGFHIATQKIIQILTRLGFQTKLLNNNWEILPPSWRFDITIEENLIAEIIRIYGYQKIPNIPIKMHLITPNASKNCSFNISLLRAKTLLVDRGYQEIITYSFVNPNIQKLLYPNLKPLVLKNPIALEMSSMRLSLWIGLIETMIYNQNRQQNDIKLFESGICFIPSKTSKNQVYQKFVISGIRSGLRFHEHWDSTNHPIDFYDIKGDIEALLHFAKKPINSVQFRPSVHSALHPGKNAAIYLNNNIHIGYIGALHPSIQNKLNLKTETIVFELSWNVIIQSILPTKINKISKFPKNYRDISIIVPLHIDSASVIQTCEEIIKHQLAKINLSDVYTGPGIPLGYKSFTIKLFLQETTHTLQETEIINIINKCTEILKNKFHAKIR